MAGELRPGVFSELFARLSVEGEKRIELALAPIALGIEKQAKINASTGSHRYGTPTPAFPGTGPARISGALVRSITHTEPVPWGVAGFECKVGVAAGAYPTYPTRRGARTSRTPSSKYGLYLETGLRNGASYPFLVPAFRHGATTVSMIVFDRIFGATWL